MDESKKKNTTKHDAELGSNSHGKGESRDARLYHVPHYI